MLNLTGNRVNQKFWALGSGPHFRSMDKCEKLEKQKTLTQKQLPIEAPCSRSTAGPSSARRP